MNSVAIGQFSGDGVSETARGKCEGSSLINETQRLRNKLKCRAKTGSKLERCGAKKAGESKAAGTNLK